ncbi:Acetyltransferase (GNAT) family protein [Aquimixticola soesokkakensis]|uniref:Acetyltransferase (GNAT) family protein n=1 Tax=Aquimixticola soesokkakensis TaxID=1519096 RepID=A0A1Y5TAC0_9RHOB|nr:GNAT family N-acetyltransferase [Aquimixticola soesokkakensis]SLN58940.1 Acetyltransferase (GNAT) family protein [Aquimixticola soesokkakensis]
MPLLFPASRPDPRGSLPAFEIRPARPSDAEAVDALYAASYPALLKPDYPAPLLDACLPLLLKTAPALLSSGSFFVADTGGGLIGAGGWTQASPFGGLGPRHLGHMRRVAVHARYARRGIGSVILDHALKAARKSGIAQMCCLSTLTARKFYEAAGFAVEGDVELTLRRGVNLPAVQMRRTLMQTTES